MIRLFQLLVVVLRYAVRPVTGLGPRENGPVRLRLALQQLGGTWIKLGQVLALRFDLLPADYCYELFKLLNEVKPFGYDQVRQIVYEDLGSYPEELFASFEVDPFAAASIGQVHRAVLHEGPVVAVKVQRPHIRRIIRRDLRLMYLLASIADLTPFFGGVRVRLVVDEFARWTIEELDYQVEARNAYSLRASAAGDPLEYDPEIYFALTSERVLTMEMIIGISLVEIMYAKRDNRTAYLEQLTRDGYDLSVIASHIAWNVLNQIYQQGYFHADLHPANLFVRPGNAIAYVDFGIVGVMASEVRESLLHYAWNLYQGNVGRAAEEMMRWIRPTDRTDLAAARADMIRVLNDYLFALQSADDPERRGPPGSSEFEVSLLNTIRAHGMTVDPSVVTYFKALITANAVIFELDPEFDLLGVENLFFGRMILESSRRMLDVRESAGSIFDFSYRALRALGSFDSLRESEQQANVFLLRVRRRLQLFAGVGVAAGAALFALYARRTSASPSWVAAVLVTVIVVIGVAIFSYGRQLQEPEAHRKKALPKRKPAARSRRRRTRR